MNAPAPRTKQTPRAKPTPQTAQRLDPVALTARLLRGPQTVQDLAHHFGVSPCAIPAAVAHTPLARLLDAADAPPVAYLKGQEDKAHAIQHPTPPETNPAPSIKTPAAPIHAPDTPPLAAPDAARFPLLASMTQAPTPRAKPSLRVVEPIAPKLTPAPRPTPTAKTGKVSYAQTAPRKIHKPCLLPQVYGPAQREAVLCAVKTLDFMREVADAASVRVRLGQKRHQEAFPKRPDESECRAMLEALAQEGALEAHGHDSDRFYILPTTANTRHRAANTHNRAANTHNR